MVLLGMLLSRPRMTLDYHGNVPSERE